MKVTLATTPQSNFRLLIRGLKLYVASFKHVFGLALLFSTIVFIPEYIAIAKGVSLLALPQLFQFYNIFFFLVDMMALFVFVALLWRIRCVITNQHESILDDFKVASKNIFLILGAAIIFALIISLFVLFLITLPAMSFLNTPTQSSVTVALGFIFLYFCIVAYIFYTLVFSIPLILTEDKGVLTAFEKSYLLVWGNWWRVFLVLTTPLFIYYMVLYIIQHVFFVNLSIPYGEDYHYQDLLVLIINVVWVAFVVPFFGSLLLLQLRDLELRKQV